MTTTQSTPEFKLNLNTTERQYDLNGDLIEFCWRCGDCDTYGNDLPTSWAANRGKTVHRKQQGHKDIKVITARKNVASSAPESADIGEISANTLASLPVGTQVRVPHRKGAKGVVIGHHRNAASGRDMVLIRFGRSKDAFNFPEQCEVL